MALGTTAALAIGLGAAGLGSFMNARQQNSAARRASAYGAEQSAWLRSLMGSGPSAAEQWGLNWLNTGQDGISQSLRTDPAARSAQTLQGIIDRQGDPFDTSGLFESLRTLDQRGLEEALATGRSDVGGLGQRFGSAQMREDNRTRERAAETASARNAGIAMQSHGDAVARMLQAATTLGNLGLAESGQQNSVLGALLQAATARRAQDFGLATAASGVGAPVEGPGYGNVLGGLGQLLLLSSMSQSPPEAAPAAAPNWGGWSMGGYEVPAYVPRLAPTTPPFLNPIY